MGEALIQGLHIQGDDFNIAALPQMGNQPVSDLAISSSDEDDFFTHAYALFL